MFLKVLIGLFIILIIIGLIQSYFKNTYINAEDDDYKLFKFEDKIKANVIRYTPNFKMEIMIGMEYEKSEHDIFLHIERYLKYNSTSCRLIYLKEGGLQKVNIESKKLNEIYMKFLNEVESSLNLNEGELFETLEHCYIEKKEKPTDFKLDDFDFFFYTTKNHKNIEIKNQYIFSKTNSYIKKTFEISSNNISFNGENIIIRDLLKELGAIKKYLTTYNKTRLIVYSNYQYLEFIDQLEEKYKKIS